MTFTTRPEIHGVFGVVGSTHWLASQHAMATLEKGGNAFDAAVVGGFVLQVVEPHLNGPLGDMPALIWPAAEGRARVVCGQGVAPAAATIETMKGFGLDVIPGSGLLAPCVPGATDAWLLMLRDYGTISLEAALRPAIDLAGGGYPIVDHMTRTIDSVAELFRDEWTTSAGVWLDHGEAPKPGRLWRNPGQAGFYEGLLEAATDLKDRESAIERARDCLKTGFVAEAIDRFCRQTEAMDVSGERHKGLLTGDDLASWSASYEDPLTQDFGDYTVAKAGMWSQGPVFLQQMAILDGMGLEDMDPMGARFVHTVTEAAKLAYADREAYYGDPDFVDVPTETLLSKAYAAERRRLIDAAASLELRPGVIDGYDNRIGQGRAERAFGPGVGEPTMDKLDDVPTTGPVDGDTCHIDVIDRHGNMVSATPSGGWLQSSPAIPALGCGLGTRAQMFWLEDGLPGSLAPGKRPRTTLSPSFALRRGEAYMPFGTPGGDGQDQWTLIFFLRHVLHGFNLQAAIDAPTFQSHHFPSSFFPRQAEPGRLVVEGRYSADVMAELDRLGHKVEAGGPWSQGRISACARDGELLKAAANPRLMQGYAVGR